MPIAPTPAEVRPSPDLPRLLTRAATDLGNALAIVSGREITSIDQVTQNAVPYAAGSHGAEFRLGFGQPILRPGPQPDIAGLGSEVLALMSDWPGILVEPKRAGLAVHYRKAPHLGQQVWSELETMLARREQSGLSLLKGDHVVEVRSPVHNKGEAVRRIMKEPAFQGRRPVFIGDDVTDEDAFVVVQEMSRHRCHRRRAATHPGDAPAELRRRRSRSAGQESRFLCWSHFLRRTGVHFGGKCSRPLPVPAPRAAAW